MEIMARRDVKRFLSKVAHGRNEIQRRAQDRMKKVEALEKAWREQRDNFAAARCLLMDFKQSLVPKIEHPCAIDSGFAS